MNESPDLAALQFRLREFAAVRSWERYHDPKSLAGSVVIEAAELLECFQWLTTEESRSVDDRKDAIASEMADVLIYLLRLADVVGIDLTAATEEKIDLNETRFPSIRDHTDLAVLVATRLGDPRLAVSASKFPDDRDQAERAGMYAWFGDEEARRMLGTVLDAPLPELLYAGQAGATSMRAAKKSGATLLSRVRGQHIRGNIRSSTMRRTFASILRVPLGLELAGPNQLANDGEARLRAWIESHLRVVVEPTDDPVVLAHLEPLVLSIIDPPLNLDHVVATPMRQRLRTLRELLRDAG